MRTLHFLVTVPNVPETDQYSDEYVRSAVFHNVRHPYDAYFDADITVVPVPSSMVPVANPERDGNGCMIYKTPAVD